VRTKNQRPKRIRTKAKAWRTYSCGSMMMMGGGEAYPGWECRERALEPTPPGRGRLESP
jgi:hypothetical protein